MDSAHLQAIVDFVNRSEKLKGTLRSGFTSAERRESTAEHSWRLALLAMLVTDGMDDVDQLRLLKLCLVHDLGEVFSGDIPAPEQNRNSNRHAQEQQDLEKLCAGLPDDIKVTILELWQEYTDGATGEAKLAKGFDKIETILQHATADNPAGFDLAFNLKYGRRYTDDHPVLTEIRKHADALTRANIEKTDR